MTSGLNLPRAQAPTQEAQPDHTMNDEPANFGGTMMRRGIHVALRAPVRVRAGVEVGVRVEVRLEVRVEVRVGAGAMG